MWRAINLYDRCCWSHLGLVANADCLVCFLFAFALPPSIGGSDDMLDAVDERPEDSGSLSATQTAAIQTSAEQTSAPILIIKSIVPSTGGWVAETERLYTELLKASRECEMQKTALLFIHQRRCLTESKDARHASTVK
eukprot:gene19897-biopygen6376